MRLLLFVLSGIVFISACGPSYQAATIPEELSEEQKLKKLGSSDGKGYRFVRESQNNLGGPIQLLEPVFSVNEETREIRASVLWQYTVGQNVARKRIKLKGRFDDYTRSIILLPIESSERGALVKGHAFCPPTRYRTATQCESVVVDFYYVNANGDLVPAQFEKTISVDLAKLEEQMKPTEAPAPDEEDHQEDEDTAEDLHHDEELQLPPGDLQSPTIEDESFYRGWLKPAPPSAQSPVIRQDKKTSDSAGPTPLPEPNLSETSPKTNPDTEASQDAAALLIRERLTFPGKDSPPSTVRSGGKKQEQASAARPMAGNHAAELSTDGSSADDSDEAEEELENDIEGTKEDFDRNQVVSAHSREDLTIFSQIGIDATTDTQQAYGRYFNGWLERALRLPESGPGLLRAQRNDPDSYGTGLLVKMLLHFAEYTEKELQSYLKVNDLSGRRGGRIDHASHQNGLDADIYYIGIDQGSFSAEKNWKVMKAMYDTGVVSTFFVNATRRNQLCAYGRSKGLLRGNEDFTKKLYAIGGHLKHFHLRLHCTALNRGICRDDAEFRKARACQ